MRTWMHIYYWELSLSFKVGSSHTARKDTNLCQTESCLKMLENAGEIKFFKNIAFFSHSSWQTLLEAFADDVLKARTIVCTLVRSIGILKFSSLVRSWGDFLCLDSEFSLVTAEATLGTTGY